MQSTVCFEDCHFESKLETLSFIVVFFIFHELLPMVWFHWFLGHRLPPFPSGGASFYFPHASLSNAYNSCTICVYVKILTKPRKKLVSTKMINNKYDNSSSLQNCFGLSWQKCAMKRSIKLIGSSIHNGCMWEVLWSPTDGRFSPTSMTPSHQ